MDSPSTNRLLLKEVPHPGRTVLEYLEFNGWSQRDLARRTGLTPKTISEICNEKAPITPPTALAFEKAFQRPAHLWLNMQRLFDEAAARNQEFANSLQWSDWVKRFPLSEMRKLKFSLPEGHSDIGTLLNFFGVASPESWDSVWHASSVAYRQTRRFKIREECIAAWVREAEIVARGLDVADFDEDRLIDSMGALRHLTRESADKVLDQIQELCAKVGIAVVLVQELQNTGISGCVKWLTDKKALIGLTLRYKTDDQFWFTLFHEIGHLLLHRNRRTFIIDNAATDLSDNIVDPEMQKYESEANQFASNVLIPPGPLSDFTRTKAFTNDSIHDFAEEIDIGPGIVVGRLQHDGHLEKHQGNALKQKLNWKFAS